MLDRLGPQLRHLLLMLLAAVLTWASTDLVPWLSGHDGWGPIALAPSRALSRPTCYRSPASTGSVRRTAPDDSRHEGLTQTPARAGASTRRAVRRGLHPRGTSRPGRQARRQTGAQRRRIGEVTCR